MRSNRRQMRNTQAQAQQIATLGTLRLTRQTHQLIAQALVLAHNQRELRTENTLRSLKMLRSLHQRTGGKTQAERGLHQQERRGHIVEETLKIIGQNILGRHKNILKNDRARLGSVERQQVTVIYNLQPRSILANRHNIPVRMPLLRILHSYRQHNHTARVQVRSPRHRAVELHTALYQSAQNLDRRKPRSLLIRRRHRACTARRGLSQTLGQLTVHRIKERNRRTMRPQREPGCRILRSKVKSNRNLRKQGPGAPQSQQTILRNLAQILKRGTLTGIDGICVFGGKRKHALALRIILKRFKSEFRHGRELLYAMCRCAYACSLKRRSMGVLTALRARSTASSSGAS